MYIHLIQTKNLSHKSAILLKGDFFVAFHQEKLVLTFLRHKYDFTKIIPEITNLVTKNDH